MIYVDDHLPAHVHAFRGDDMVVIYLESLEIREVRGMNRRDVRMALDIVTANQTLLLQEWKRLHP